nr:tetrahydrofolate dehydrogenase/cyclohydrolase catalytic domain-containing protein [Streptococcus equi]
MVGDNPASQVYVRNKERAALAAGFKSETVRLSDSVCQEELIELIEQYNQDDTIHGILVQLPLPHHINDKSIILAIDPKKDVDGFHPMNTGLCGQVVRIWSLVLRQGLWRCFMTMVSSLKKNAVIVGRSNIVGSLWPSCC